MTIRDVHSPDKPVSAVALLMGGEGTVISIQILKGQTLKEHLSKVPALLVLVEGKASYEDERGMRLALSPGDRVDIEPMVKHWVVAEENSYLLLAK